MISFNRSVVLESQYKYVYDVIKNGETRGDEKYCVKCINWLKNFFSIRNVLLTSSCTHSLEMTALLSDIKNGDEVIMPSYTFCSTADAFALRGAKIIFVDIRPDTMNIDENLIENAITKKTKLIVPVHYAGVSADMDSIMKIAHRHNIIVVEDAAQGVMSRYKGRPLGTMGDFGCYSFHETKNYSMGEGGALVVNNDELIERAEIIREKGTDRSKFLRGQVDKYSWIDIGSSYLPSNLAAAYLYAQLEIAEEINNNRLHSWNMYYKGLTCLAEAGWIDLPTVPSDCQHNAHMFYIKAKNLAERTSLIAYLKKKGIVALFHYIPLHSSVAGRKYGFFFGEDKYTTIESERLVRLPLYYRMSQNDIFYVVEAIKKFYRR